MKWMFYILIVFMALPARSAPNIEWTLHKTVDGLHPDGNEQQMLWLMNRARKNPSLEGWWLANLRQANVQSAMNYFNVLRGTMIAEFEALSPEPPAAFDRRLFLAAEGHSTYLIGEDAQNHSNQFTRITNEGFFFTNASVSVFSCTQDPLHGHGAFNIDWGGNDGTGMQTGRGHRAAIMGDLPNVGIACVPEANTSTAVGPLVTSINYCSANPYSNDHFNVFLVGTVWSDSNLNGLYDPGEGLGNVHVMPDKGDYYAVTGLSGGYSIPVTAATYTVTFSDGGLSESQTRMATVGSDSVLVDLLDATTYPHPLMETTINPTNGTATFSVSNQIKGWSYHVLESTNLNESSWTWSGELASGYSTNLTIDASFIESNAPIRFLRFEAAPYF